MCIKRFPNLRDLIVRADTYGIKPLKEVDQDPRCSDFMKRCDSCKVFVDHTPSFKCFARQYFTCTTPYMIYLAYCTKFGNYGAGSTENRKPRLFNYKAHMKKVKSRSIVKHSIDCWQSNYAFEVDFDRLRY